MSDNSSFPSDGIILVDKPHGVSSFSVVADIRRRFDRKTKVGHAGTLDPFATGLLIILVGKATRVQRFLMALPKCYLVEAQLGFQSTTGDPEGEVTPGKTPDLTHLPTGKIQQRPPAYSAIKIGGQRAYKLARKGESVILPEREVTIYRFEQVEPTPVKTTDRVQFLIECSAGTYVRSLIADLSDAYCTQLRRESIGQFSVSQANEEKLIPIDDALSFFPQKVLNNEESTAIRYGRSLAADDKSEPPNKQTIRLIDKDGLVAIAENEDAQIRPIVCFRPNQ
jgi:tRNA pseudouridine55 synthase